MRQPALRVSSLLLPLLLLTVIGGCRSKKPIASMPVPDPRWAVIDSLAGIGQFATALERTDAQRG